MERRITSQRLFFFVIFVISDNAVKEGVQKNTFIHIYINISISRIVSNFLLSWLHTVQYNSHLCCTWFLLGQKLGPRFLHTQGEEEPANKLSAKYIIRNRKECILFSPPTTWNETSVNPPQARDRSSDPPNAATLGSHQGGGASRHSSHLSLHTLEKKRLFIWIWYSLKIKTEDSGS